MAGNKDTRIPFLLSTVEYYLTAEDAEIAEEDQGLKSNEKRENNGH